MPLRERYPGWAVVAGGALGLGAAFVRRLADEGLDVAVCDVDGDGARALAARPAPTRLVPIEVDLARADAAERLVAAVPGEIGLLVFNAARSAIGPWLEQDLASDLAVAELNVLGLLRVLRAVAGPMAARGRGGLLIVGSAAGLHGHARVATYGATKAFVSTLATSLWSELGPRGVDVLAACPGATATPAYLATGSRLPRALAAEPDDVAREALEALGRHGPVRVLGAANRWTDRLLRVLPRAASARATDALTRFVYGGSRPRS